ncbi:hypothetical protein GY45DRAFT_1370094 [Cubamyces sp. BRFM 1775]|nr:hypothetical protein GY45DRAFT_1370094 [Cubamyces sp. BRFM 1775]
MKTVVIDDTYGDELTGTLPVYSPPANWAKGQPCGLPRECPMTPEPSMARNGTWHGSAGATADTPPRTIDLNFNGNWFSVYCIILEGDRDNVAVSNMAFELDGREVGRYYHDVSGQTRTAGDPPIRYNVSVFNASVPDGQHALRISSVGYSRTLFDYVLYTTNTDPSDSTTPPIRVDASIGSGQAAAVLAVSAADPPSSNARASPAVVAGVVIAVAVILLMIGASLFVLRRKRLARLRQARCINLNPPDGDQRLAYSFGGEDNIEARASAVSHRESLSLDTHPYTHLLVSGSHDDLLPPSPQEPSPSESSMSLLHSSIYLHSDPPPSRKLPRVVVMGTETRLEGPDNSMARIARQRVAEREAELTGRVHEA